MPQRDRNFERYEDAAVEVVKDLAAALGISKVEGPQLLHGHLTDWRVEGRAWRDGDEGFLVLECRRVKTGQKQEEVAGLAFRVRDVGAHGAILVTPISPQTGAQRIAAATNVKVLLLDADATPDDYIARLLHHIFVKRTERVAVSEEVHWELRGPDGTIEAQG